MTNVDLDKLRNCANCRHSLDNEPDGFEYCPHCRMDTACCSLTGEDNSWRHRCDKWEFRDFAEEL